MMKATVSRRSALMGASAMSALGMAGALGSATPAKAQGGVTLRWWSTQSVPAQLEAYKFQIAQFEAANPGIKVVFEPTSNETYAAQLAAAFASGVVEPMMSGLGGGGVMIVHDPADGRAYCVEFGMRSPALATAPSAMA